MLDMYVGIHVCGCVNHRLIKDIGSGLNYKRKGFKTILDLALGGNLQEVVVTYKDRLCRFGFELIESLVVKSGGKITVLDTDGNKSGEQELAEDLLSIIHVYSCKQMGKRSYSNRPIKVSQNQVETVSSTEEDIE